MMQADHASPRQHASGPHSRAKSRTDARLKQLLDPSRPVDLGALTRLLVRILQRRYRLHDAEDIAADVILRLHDKLERRSSTTRRLKYLYRTLRSAKCDRWRRSKATKRSHGCTAAVDAADLHDNSEAAITSGLQLELREAIAQLPAVNQRIIILIQSEHTVAEIADILEVSDKTVAKRLRHARDRLHRLLSPSS